jgi:hypothetical protein
VTEARAGKEKSDVHLRPSARCCCVTIATHMQRRGMSDARATMSTAMQEREGGKGEGVKGRRREQLAPTMTTYRGQTSRCPSDSGPGRAARSCRQIQPAARAHTAPAHQGENEPARLNARTDKGESRWHTLPQLHRGERFAQPWRQQRRNSIIAHGWTDDDDNEHR